MTDQESDIAFGCHEKWQKILARALERAAPATRPAIESAACLLAEAVQRDRGSAHDEGCLAIWAKLKEVESPLAWLALDRVDLEAGVPVWNFNRNGGGSLGVTAMHDGPSLPQCGPVRIESRVDLPPHALAAFKEMGSRSNGRSDGWWGVSENRLLPSQEVASRLLTELPRTGRKERAASDAESAFEIGPDWAVGTVVGAAVNGGAYTHGFGAAFGRFAGWKSLAFLTGVEDAPFAEVVDSVRRSKWLQLPTTAHWFYGVAWDGFIACINPTGNRIAAVCWTDTD
ncbi:MAG: hypothetical protein JNM86_13405 [Phycisphaerae bacterium]|nr:hypothetical protein [Phycisphaerae bacterium]